MERYIRREMNKLMIKGMNKIDTTPCDRQYIMVRRNDEWESDEFVDWLNEIVDEYENKIRMYEECVYRFEIKWDMNSESVGIDGLPNEYEISVTWVTYKPLNPFGEMLIDDD